MTEQTTETTEATEPAVDSTETSSPAPSNREARYRRELRETEAERDTLRAQVEDYQRAEAERLSGLEKGAALWASGVALSDLLDDEGHIDPERVAQAAQGAVEALGARPAAREPRPDYTQGGMGGGVQQTDPWTSAFTDRGA